MTVVAVVPAKDRHDSVGATVAALGPLVDEVLVVDDGSRDDTTGAAARAGARVLTLPENRGKGGAVAAGVQAAPEADVYLLVDADVGDTAAVAHALLAPVLAGEADMAIGVLPPAAGRGGFGQVRNLARAGIERAAGFRPQAPLSGQRAVRGELLRSLELAPRFGLEVGLTIDALRAGARVVEVDVPMEHRHTGKSVAGFRHRARQGVDIVRALWPRLTSSAFRVGAIVVAFVVLAAAAVWMGSLWRPSSAPATTKPAKVVLVSVPDWSLQDLADRPPGGAASALFVRTLSRTPSALEGYATVGAGTRVAATAVDMPTLRRENANRDVSSYPGALGTALRTSGRRTAVVGSDVAALAVGDHRGTVDFGPFVPDPGKIGEGISAALARADVVLVETNSVDEVLAAVGDDVLVIAFSPAPPGEEWNLAPVAAWGAGVRPGYLHSASTSREGLVAITDIAPTVLDVFDIPAPDGMVGRVLRYRPGQVDVDKLIDMDEEASFRQRVYVPLTTGYVTVQALAYLFAIIAFSRLGRLGRAGPPLKLLVLAVSAWPVATFVLRATPGTAQWGAWAVVYLHAVVAALVLLSLRARRHPLSPLAWLAGLTVAVIVVDVWTGSRLQASSILGYSLQTAGRFTGLGNTTFAVLAATTVLAACLHVHHAPRPREALVTAAGICGLVVLTDGLPTLGADVGGILSLVPIFGLLLVVLARGRVTWRMLVVAGAAGVLAFVAAALIDYMRPIEARTHLGELVADLRSQGLAPLWTTISRKVKGNLRTISSPWTWTVPIITAYVLWMLGWAKGWQRLLPKGSALRAAALGVLGVGILGNVVNDSGIVVTAVVFVYLGPLLTLVAMNTPAVRAR